MNTRTLNRPTFSILQKAAVFVADWCGWLCFVDREIIEEFKAANSVPKVNRQNPEEILAKAEAKLKLAQADLLIADAESKRALTEHRRELFETLKTKGVEGLLSNENNILTLILNCEHSTSEDENETAGVSRSLASSEHTGQEIVDQTLKGSLHPNYGGLVIPGEVATYSQSGFDEAVELREAFNQEGSVESEGRLSRGDIIMINSVGDTIQGTVIGHVGLTSGEIVHTYESLRKDDIKIKKAKKEKVKKMGP